MGTKSRETIYGGSVRAAAKVVAVRSRFVSKGDSDARAGFGDFGDLVGFGNVVGSRPNV
jgi:hypothetical protein